MTLDRGRAGPPQGKPAPVTPDQTTAKGSTDSVTEWRGIGAHPERPVGCPCGHDPAYDDECARHRPLADPVDWSESAVGLVDGDGPRVTSLRRYHAERGAAA